MALVVIWVYQNAISPHKGYRCAYSVVHGGTGCSGYAKHAIRDRGVLKAIPVIRERLADCADAARHLRTDIDCGCAPDIDLDAGCESLRACDTVANCGSCGSELFDFFRGDKRRKNQA